MKVSNFNHHYFYLLFGFFRLSRFSKLFARISLILTEWENVLDQSPNFFTSLLSTFQKFSFSFERGPSRFLSPVNLHLTAILRASWIFTVSNLFETLKLTNKFLPDLKISKNYSALKKRGSVRIREICSIWDSGLGKLTANKWRIFWFKFWARVYWLWKNDQFSLIPQRWFFNIFFQTRLIFFHLQVH